LTIYTALDAVDDRRVAGPGIPEHEPFFVVCRSPTVRVPKITKRAEPAAGLAVNDVIEPPWDRADVFLVHRRRVVAANAPAGKRRNGANARARQERCLFVVKTECAVSRHVVPFSYWTRVASRDSRSLFPIDIRVPTINRGCSGDLEWLDLSRQNDRLRLARCNFSDTG
jgi:hypothetical protein